MNNHIHRPSDPMSAYNPACPCSSCEAERQQRSAGGGLTPRTDALSGTAMTRKDSDDFARQLERELAAAQAEVARLKESFSPNGALARENARLLDEVHRLTAISDVHRETGIALAAELDDLRAQLKAPAPSAAAKKEWIKLREWLDSQI